MNKPIKYGDILLLHSLDDPHSFLSARSLLEESVYFIQLPANLSFSTYDGLSELYFTLYPKLFYEAFKIYEKYEQNDSRKKILGGRMEGERETNQKRIERYLGEPITIGSEVQIYHIASNCFIKATKERNPRSNQLLNLKVGKGVGGGMSWKIKANPFFNFKKEGEKLTYEDQFYFENVKNGSGLVYKGLPLAGKTEEKISIQKSRFKSGAKVIKLEYPSLMEGQNLYKIFEAGHRKDEINIFKAIFVKKGGEEGGRNINWGDYVRIKHLRRGDQKHGTLYSQQIVIGQSPEIHLVTQEHEFIEEKESSSSIFQILTWEEEQIGAAIEIEEQGFSLWLRHLLTGRFLKIGEEKGKVVLSENLDQFSQKHPYIIDGGGKGIRSRRTSQSNWMRRVNYSSRNTIIPSQESFGEENLKAEFESPELQEFLNQNEIYMTVASKDDDKLTSSNCFTLKNKTTEKFLGVVNEETVIEGRFIEDMQSDEKSFISSDCFQRYFFNMNPLEQKNYDLKIAENGDFFFFTPVEETEINDIITIKSKMFPLIKMINNEEYGKSETLNQADNCLNSFSIWICEGEEKKGENRKNNKNGEKQKLLRECGVIDLIMKILYEAFERKMLVEEGLPEMLAVAGNAIKLLNLVVEGNYSNPNSIYVFQWYSLFKMIITIEDSASELKIDQLLINLFSKTKLNVSYQNDLEKLIPSINFENLNKNALNLVIAFCSHNEFLQKEDVESMILTVLDSKQTQKIFRCFDIIKNEKTNENKIIFHISDNHILEFNNQNYIKKKKIFDYVANLILLSIELSKGNPVLVEPIFQRIYPFDVCLEIFKNNDVNFLFKSLFLSLFKESYFAYDCRYKIPNTFNNIRFKKNISNHWLGDSKYSKYNIDLTAKYFTESIQDNPTDINLLKLINYFLKSPSFFSPSCHPLILSLLSLLLSLLSLFLLPTSSSAELRNNLQEFIKNSFIMFLGSGVGVGVGLGIECVWMMERRNQEGFLNDFWRREGVAKVFGENKDSRRYDKEIEKKTKNYLFSLQYPDSVDIFYWFELLIMGRMDVSQKVVELISLVFSLRKNFLIGVNTSLLLEEAQTTIYQNLLSVMYKLHFALVDIQFTKSDEGERLSQLMFDVDFNLKKLLALFLKTKEEVSENEEDFYQIDSEFFFQKKENKLIQDLLRELDLHSKILQIIILVSRHVTVSDKSVDIKNVLLRKCIIFLIFFNYDNQENQTAVRATKLEDLLYEIVNTEEKDLQRIVFILILVIYKDNYLILFSLEKANNDLISKLGKKFASSFRIRNNKDFCIYYLQMITLFFKIKNKILSQNQNYLVKELGKFSQDLQSAMEKCIEISKKTDINTKIEEKRIINVNQEIELLTVFFNFLNQLCEKPNSNVISFANQFISMKEIGDLLLNIDDWLMLKLELITFLNHVFVKNKKLEESKQKELQIFIKEVIFAVLEKYLLNPSKNKVDFTFKSQTINIFDVKTHYSDNKNLISISFNNLYEKYILYGIVEIIANYLERIPDMPEESDFLMMEMMMESLENLAEFLGKNQDWMNCSFVKKQMIKLNIPKKESFMQLAGPLDETNAEMPEKITKIDPRILRSKIKACLNKIRITKENPMKTKNSERLDRFDNSERSLYFNEKLIEEEHSIEMEYMTGFLIEIKLNETQNQQKFKKIVRSLIDVVGHSQTPVETKLKAIKIIRKISNYKKDMKINAEIQKELVEIKLMDFLCKVTAEESNPLIIFEYISGLIDFMDEANSNIQRAFYKYLENDEENKFILKIRDYILNNFNDFKDFDHSINEQFPDSLYVSSQLSKLIGQKLNACTSAFELLRLSCENHYLDMQNFLREQIQNHKLNSKSVNMIIMAAELLEKYSKIISFKSIALGEILVDFLTETLQGPCNANQQILCSLKLVENLDDILDLAIIKNSEKFSAFTNKIIILLLALFEGNQDPFVINKIASYVTPEQMFKRISFIYQRYYPLSKNNFTFSNITRMPTNNYYAHVTMEKDELELTLFHEESQDEAKRPTMSSREVENFLSEGFNSYILMKTLNMIHEKFAEKIRLVKEITLSHDSSKEQERFKKTLKFFKMNVGMIEIINSQKNVQRVFFRLPRLTKFLSKETISKFIETVNRESIDEKINGLLGFQPEFLEEMQHFMKLRAKGVRMSIQTLSFLRDISFIVTFIICFIILFDQNNEAESILNFLGVLQLVLAVIIWIFLAVFQLPLDYRKACRIYTERGETEQKKEKLFFMGEIQRKRMSESFRTAIEFYFVLLREMTTNSYLIYFTLNIIWATLGLTVSKIYNSLLLIDIIDRSAILQNVVKAITINWPQLFMTGVLGIIVMFIYSMIGFYASEDFRNNMVFDQQVGINNDENLYLCDSPLRCFMFVVNMGLRAGGGVGEVIKQPLSDDRERDLYNARFFYDLSFFILISIIWLNIIFGIIVDTFAELRDQKNKKDFDIKNNCFICNKERSLFEKVGISFNKHAKKEHNPWNYLFFVIHLQLKDPNDYNGTESYVANKLKTKDISWFPIERSLSLEAKIK